MSESFWEPWRRWYDGIVFRRAVADKRYADLYLPHVKRAFFATLESAREDWWQGKRERGYPESAPGTWLVIQSNWITFYSNLLSRRYGLAKPSANRIALSWYGEWRWRAGAAE